jgi:hypothetical protein
MTMTKMAFPMAASPRLPEEEDAVAAIVHNHPPPGVAVILVIVVPSPDVLRPPSTITDMTIDVIVKRMVDE